MCMMVISIVYVYGLRFDCKGFFDYLWDMNVLLRGKLRGGLVKYLCCNEGVN